MKIIYMGFNSFKIHKRGVENVIEFQSKALNFSRIYYIHFGEKNYAYKYSNFICISLKHSILTFFAINKIISRIKSPQTILHSHNPLFSFYYTKKTDLFTVHDGLYYLSKNNGAGRLRLLLFKYIEKRVYGKSNKIHFISNFTKQMSLFNNECKYIIIPNTSNYESVVTANFFDLKHTITHKPIKVLSVRSIEERARFDLLLEVADRLGPDFEFNIIGKGPLLSKFQIEVNTKKLNNVHFYGFIQDNELFKFYQNTDIVLTLAEYGEGFGLPIIESYLFDCPVIASNKCAIPEIIISREHLVENNINSIISKLISFDFSKKYNYRDYYMLNFSNNTVLKRMRDLYNEYIS